MWTLARKLVPRVRFGHGQGGWFWGQEQTDNQLVYTHMTLQLSTAHIHSGWSMPMLYWLLTKYSEYHFFRRTALPSWGPLLHFPARKLSRIHPPPPAHLHCPLFLVGRKERNGLNDRSSLLTSFSWSTQEPSSLGGGKGQERRKENDRNERVET